MTPRPTTTTTTPGTTTALLLLSLAAAHLGRSSAQITTVFVDDDGTTHEIPRGATIATGAMDAVAFSHFGLPPDRILATFGERSSSGSNHGGFYYDGNVVYGDVLPHGETPYDPDVFPADPNREERAYLGTIGGDLSADCSSSNYYCDIVDIGYLDENGWPDLIVVGAFYGSLLSDELVGNATEVGIPIVVLKNAYEGDEESAATDRPLDMIAMVERMEELALALGAIEDETVVGNDKESLCKAADSFRQTALAAQEKGVRSMASYMPYIGGNPKGMTGAFLPNPDRDPVLGMMQNLGMPIVYNEHSGSYWESRAGDYSPGAGNLQATNTTSLSGSALYNVDFWLYDDRVSLDFLSDEFAKDWPHPAILEQQYAYWPSNARILSYKHAAEILGIVEGRLAEAERVTPATDCTAFDGVPGAPRDLAPGEYSCAAIKPLAFCGNENKNKNEDHSGTGTKEDDSGGAAGDTGDEKKEDETPGEPAVEEEPTSDTASSGSARILRTNLPWWSVPSMMWLVVVGVGLME